MPPTKHNHRSSASTTSAATTSTTSTNSTTTPDWISEAINGGSLPCVDLNHGVNGWASPPGDVFCLRSTNYFTKRQKSPAGDALLSPAGMDWLKSSAKLHNVLARPDNRIALALKKSQSEGKSGTNTFIIAINLQVPGKDPYSAVFYFATEEPILPGSLLHRFVNEGDAFRNQRFKIVTRIVKGPFLVKKAVGSYSACLLGRTLKCSYHRGENYLEIDVDIGSSRVATYLLQLALGCASHVTVDMGFLVESQEQDELPERLIGAIRVCQMELSAAAVVPAAAGGGAAASATASTVACGVESGNVSNQTPIVHG